MSVRDASGTAAVPRSTSPLPRGISQPHARADGTGGSNLHDGAAARAQEQLRGQWRARADGWQGLGGGHAGDEQRAQEHRHEARCLREEVFGPHLAVIPFRSNDDAVRIYNDTDYGLSLAVVTEDYRAMRLFREECEFGMGYVNLPCIGAEVHLPFGGVKKSGNGHPSAAGLIETVTHKVAWTVNHGTEIKMAQGLTID